MSHEVHTYLEILTLVSLFVFSIYIIYSTNALHKKIDNGKDIHEPLCNCFASQYNGSKANPEEKCYYGGYCYDKEKITKLYDEGVFSQTYAGV